MPQKSFSPFVLALQNENQVMHRKAIKAAGVCYCRAPSTSQANFCDFKEDAQRGKTAAAHVEKKQNSN